MLEAANNIRWRRICVQRYLEMYWGPEGNEAENANVWQKTIITWDRMGGGMTGEPLQGTSVHVGNRAASHVTPWGRSPARHWPDRRAEGGPRGQTASRNTHGGRAPSLNWCGLGPSRGPFRDDTQEYGILLVLSLTSVSSKRVSHSDPASQQHSQPGRQVGAHPILRSPLNSCQRAVTSTEVCGFYNFDTLFIWLFFLLKFTTPMTRYSVYLVNVISICVMILLLWLIFCWCSV